MIKYFTVLGLSALSATAVFAEARKESAPSDARSGRSAFAQAPLSDAYNPYIVRDERGEIIGADPDVNIRNQLLRDHDIR